MTVQTLCFTAQGTIRQHQADGLTLRYSVQDDILSCIGLTWQGQEQHLAGTVSAQALPSLISALNEREQEIATQQYQEHGLTLLEGARGGLAAYMALSLFLPATIQISSEEWLLLAPTVGLLLRVLRLNATAQLEQFLILIQKYIHLWVTPAPPTCPSNQALLAWITQLLEERVEQRERSPYQVFIY